MPSEKEREDKGPQGVLAVGPLRTVAPRSFVLIVLFRLALFHTRLGSCAPCAHPWRS